MEEESTAADTVAEPEWQPPKVEDATAESAVSSPMHVSDELEPKLEPALEEALLAESDGDFPGFSPRPEEPSIMDTAGETAGGWSSADSMPGSPGELVIAESGSEAESRGRRATSAAPSTASDVSSGSSKSRSRLFDPTLPIYRKPFDFGFKREIVYRSTFDVKRENNCADIYYYPPTGRKLRSSVEVGKYLAEMELPLALESFSFAKEPLGMNDLSKEIVRFAKPKQSDSPPTKVVNKRPPAPIQKPSPKAPQVNGGASRPPKRARKSTFQDPVWLTNDAKNKGGLAPCGIHCAKGAGLVPSLQCSSCVCLYHPVCVGLTHLDSSILHGYVCTNCRPQKPAAPVIKPPPKVAKGKQKPVVEDNNKEAVQSLAVLDGRQFVVVPRGPQMPPPAPPQEGALPVSRAAPAEPQSSAAVATKPLPISFSTDLAARMSALIHVFSFLSVKELLRASRVCSSWRLLAENRPLWRVVRLKNSAVRSWSDCARWMGGRGTECVDMRKMMLPMNVDWSGDVAAGLSQIPFLRSLEICRCPGMAVAMLASKCPRLEALSATSVASEVEIDLEAVSKLAMLQRLRLRGVNSPLHPTHFPALQNLQRLTCLSITNASPLPGEDVAQVLNALPNLELLELGECADMVQNAEILTEVIAKLQKLKRLRLEHLVSQQHNAELLVTFFESLTVLPKLQHLELVHVEAPPGCDLQLARLSPLRSLLLLPSYAHQGSTSSQVLLKGVSQLVGLRQLVIGLTPSICESAQQLHQQKLLRMSPQQSPHPQPNEDCLPVAAPVPLGPHPLDMKPYSGKLNSIEVIPAWHLQQLLKEALPKASVDVRRLPHPSRFTLDEWPIHSNSKPGMSIKTELF